MTFGCIQFRENNVRANDILGKWRSAIRRFGKIAFGSTTIRKNVVRRCQISVIRRFGYVTVLSNYDRWCFIFGETMIRWNNVSGKWCGPMPRLKEVPMRIGRAPKMQNLWDTNMQNYKHTYLWRCTDTWVCRCKRAGWKVREKMKTTCIVSLAVIVFSKPLDDIEIDWCVQDYVQNWCWR